MSIVPFIQDDGKEQRYREGPFSAECIATNAGIPLEHVWELARKLSFFAAVDQDQFDGQQAAAITREAQDIG